MQFFFIGINSGKKKMKVRKFITTGITVSYCEYKNDEIKTKKKNIKI